MKDETLERIWKQRQAISKRCGYDSRNLVAYYQKRNQPEPEKIITSAARSSSTK